MLPAMKQFMLGLSISLAFIVGCVTATYAPELAAPAANATPSGGRYKCARKIEGTAGTVKGYLEKLEASLNAEGTTGWRLVLHDGSAICFERVES